MPSKTWADVRKQRLAREATDSNKEILNSAQFAAIEERIRASVLHAVSLVAPKGDPGAPGTEGREGRSGADGRHGIDGKHGRDGLNGRDGKDGMSLPGINGKDGAPGSSGRPGAPGAIVSRSLFERDAGQRISAVVEYLTDGTERRFTVMRDATGRPVSLE